MKKAKSPAIMEHKIFFLVQPSIMQIDQCSKKY